MNDKNQEDFKQLLTKLLSDIDTIDSKTSVREAESEWWVQMRSLRIKAQHIKTRLIQDRINLMRGLVEKGIE